jgi:peptidoglycan/LPS O-acetylase OafA/YrhL
MGTEEGSRVARLHFIDGLRGIAASMVVLYHLAGRTDATWFTQLGYLGVAIFFVISGFVIAMVATDCPITWGFLGRFAARRSLRLDPPYWLSLALAVILALMATRFGVIKTLPNPTDIGLHFLYLQDFAGATPISPIYWTLCLEIQFYVVLILCLWTRWPLIMVLALSGWSLLEHAQLTDVSPRGLFVPYWFAFAAGSLTYWNHVGKLRTHYLCAALAVLLLFTIGHNGAWCLTATLTASILVIASRLHRMGSWLSGLLPQFLGRISYSLYLFHPLVGWSAQSLALRYLNQWGALAVGIAVSVLCAWVVYRVVERPSIALSHYVSLR